MNKPLIIAQISDCHLFADVNMRHFGANVYQHLLLILTEIKKNSSIDYLIFSGDLTQDHSELSYQRFVDAVKFCQITIPCYFLAGNHDEPKLLNDYLTGSPFQQQKIINTKHWQIILLDSKSASPAGIISPENIAWLQSIIDKQRAQLLLLHHHPLDVGYFIDRHGLINKREFWQVVAQYDSIKAVACGHVHQGLTLCAKNRSVPIPVFTCPATSIQFDPQQVTASANSQGPGYRLFSLSKEQQITSTVHYLG